jgi:UDP-N-acetylglucosamine:LPS N-acetylglucosamine transferase
MSVQDSTAQRTSPGRPKRVLAVASGGGHWVQMMRLRPVFDAHSTFYVTTMPGLAVMAGVTSSAVVRDASRRHPFSVLLLVFQLLVLFARVRPDVVVSTGAAPGLVALFIGRCLRCRTVWIDSIANAEELSMSGRVAGRVADLWLTQWPHLARDEGPFCRGSVL